MTCHRKKVDIKKLQKEKVDEEVWNDIKSCE